MTYFMRYREIDLSLFGDSSRMRVTGFSKF
jgi:hypothetical protein